MEGKIIFEGSFSNKNVICRYHKKSSRKIDRDIEKAAHAVWLKTLREAMKTGKKIWDQPVYRLEKFNIKNNKCILDFSTIPFSIRSSLKEHTSDLVKRGADYFPMATYSSIFIKTTNDSFVFGKKSDQYITNRKFTYIGGVFNRGDDKNEQVDIFRETLKEVKEELEINSSDITDFKLLGAFKSEALNVGFIFYCKLKLSDKEVSAKFKTRNDDELKNLFFVKRNKLRNFCVNSIGKESEMVDIFENNVYE